MASKTSILVLSLALFVGYLMHTPIPEGMVDTLHYRFLTGGLKLADLVARIRTLVQPGDDVYYQTLGYVGDIALGAADKEVQGSNIQARYVEFDGIMVLVYEPLTKKKELAPGLVYFHGGGYCFGSTTSHSPLTRKLAEELDIVVVSVEYRMAPANPFPASFEDSFAAVKWFLNHASDYGVDPNRVVVSGDSAGGHMSAVISQQVLDDATLPNIKLQVLIYPWIQLFDMNTPSYRRYKEQFGDTGIVSKPSAARFMSALILGKLDQTFMQHAQANAHTSGEFKETPFYTNRLDHKIIYQKLNIAAPSGREVSKESNDTLWAELRDTMLDPRLSPLLRDDLSGLPTAFVITADLDSIRDDGIFYATALEKAGVDVTWKNYEGAYHGIVAAGPIKDIPTGLKIVHDMIRFIKNNA